MFTRPESSVVANRSRRLTLSELNFIRYSPFPRNNGLALNLYATLTSCPAWALALASWDRCPRRSRRCHPWSRWAMSRCSRGTWRRASPCADSVADGRSPGRAAAALRLSPTRSRIGRTSPGSLWSDKIKGLLVCKAKYFRLMYSCRVIERFWFWEVDGQIT